MSYIEYGACSLPRDALIRFRLSRSRSFLMMTRTAVVEVLCPVRSNTGTRQADSARAGCERPIGPCAGVIARAVSVLAGPPQDRATHAELELLQVGLD